MKKNIILVGFMGTGKTTIGSHLSQLLNWPQIDTDSEIEESLNMSIPQIFEDKGEAFFRKKEALVLQQILNKEKQIVTTGGGIVLHPENVERMQNGGLVVALSASYEVIVQRVSKNQNRPLLTGDVEHRVRKLMEERKGKYDFAPVQIDTSQLTVEEIGSMLLSELKKLGWLDHE